MIPLFTAKEPADAEAADRFFRAAIECTHNEPQSTHEVVKVTRNLEHKWAAGMARFDEDGLYEIALKKGAGLGVLAHEVAHVWIHEGPPGLVEGRADLLMTCIADRVPELLAGPSFDTSNLAALVDLRIAEGIAESDDPDAIHALYEGSYRLFRTAAVAIPREVLWAEDLTTWQQFESVLEAFPKAAPLLEALRGGAKTQREALTDGDGDSRTALTEAILGTSDGSWDTDGDGWWDGSELRAHPETAIPLPRDGTPVCLAQVPVDRTGVVVMGGDLAGYDVAGLTRTVYLNSFFSLSKPMLESAGGVWVGVESPSGAKLGPNRYCAFDDKVTARSNVDVDHGVLRDLVVAVRRLLDSDPKLPAAITSRVVVEIDEDSDLYVHHVGPYLRLPLLVLQDAHPKRLDALAAALLARQSVHNIGVASIDDNGAAAVVAKDLVDHPNVWYSAAPFDVADWKRALRACDEGWEGLTSGYCARP